MAVAWVAGAILLLRPLLGASAETVAVYVVPLLLLLVLLYLSGRITVKLVGPEGLLPAPESAHAIHAAIAEAKKADAEGAERVILFNLSGHGFFDLAADDDFLTGKLADHEHSEEKVREALRNLPKVVV